MKNYKKRRQARLRRKIRSIIFGTEDRPRIHIFRSNKHIFLQAIDDEKSRTICSMSDIHIKEKEKLTKTEKAIKLGEEFGKLLLQKKINQCLFDRGFYSYAGRVKCVAESIRKMGVKI